MTNLAKRFLNILKKEDPEYKGKIEPGDDEYDFLDDWLQDLSDKDKTKLLDELVTLMKSEKITTNLFLDDKANPKRNNVLYGISCMEMPLDEAFLRDYLDKIDIFVDHQAYDEVLSLFPDDSSSKSVDYLKSLIEYNLRKYSEAMDKIDERYDIMSRIISSICLKIGKFSKVKDLKDIYNYLKIDIEYEPTNLNNTATGSFLTGLKVSRFFNQEEFVKTMLELSDTLKRKEKTIIKRDIKRVFHDNPKVRNALS